MIDYSPFWETLAKSNESVTTLENMHHISNATIHKLRHNMNMTLMTVNDLCHILDCDVADIAKYVPSDDDQFL